MISEPRYISSHSHGSPADWHRAFTFNLNSSHVLENIVRITAAKLLLKHFNGKNSTWPSSVFFALITQLSSFLLILHLVNQLSYSLMYARCTRQMFSFFFFWISFGNQQLSEVSKKCGHRLVHRETISRDVCMCK